MKHLSSISLLLTALVLLSACGQAVRPSGPTSGPPPPSDPSAQGVNAAGNWQFRMTSTVSGMPSTAIAGSITQSGASVSGAVHVDGSNCFDRLTTIALTGTLTGSDVSVTSASVNGQVANFTGTISDDALNGANSAFTGTYTISGGCANGDHGSVTGIRIPFIGNNVSGTFTSSNGGTYDVSGDQAQDGTPSKEGSFGITGTVSFRTSCFSSGMITPGIFPSGSFIIGTSVALKINTDNVAVTFLVTLKRDRSEIVGNYVVSGGTCDQAGTAVLLVSSPWDY
jgi:hypothetical protein